MDLIVPRLIGGGTIINGDEVVEDITRTESPPPNGRRTIFVIGYENRHRDIGH